MIELTLTELAVAIVGGCLVFVAGAVAISRWGNRNAERRGIRSRVICRICRHVFEDQGHEHLVTCPECGASNEKTK